MLGCTLIFNYKLHLNVCSHRDQSVGYIDIVNTLLFTLFIACSEQK